MKVCLELTGDITLAEANNFYEDFLAVCRRYDEFVLRYSVSMDAEYGK